MNNRPKNLPRRNHDVVVTNFLERAKTSKCGNLAGNPKTDVRQNHQYLRKSSNLTLRRVVLT